jgi:hypothetical protein
VTTFSQFTGIVTILLSGVIVVGLIQCYYLVRLASDFAAYYRIFRARCLPDREEG